MSTPDKPTLIHPAAGTDGMTDLHQAAHAGDLEGLINCLSNGASVNGIDTYRGYTALHWLCDMAATGGPRDEMLRKLVDHGADINKKSADGISPLTLARDARSDMGDSLASMLVALGARE